MTLIDFSMALKHKKQHHLPHPFLKGKNIALIFEKPSTRTRAAFSVAAHDLLVTGAILGVNIHIAAPENLQPHPDVQTIAHQYAEQSGGNIMITENVQQAVYHTDILYTDVWVSMGTDESEWGTRIENMLPYQINDTLLVQADNPDLIVMHCLPAFHNLETTTSQKLYDQFGLEALEITDSVFNGPNSVVFEQAENRLHAIKAIMAATLGELF